MTSTSIGVQTGTERLHVTMKDTPSLRSATGFGEVFRDLDSLLFVSALLIELEPPETTVLSRLNPAATRFDPAAGGKFHIDVVNVSGWSIPEFEELPASDPVQRRSAAAISRARQTARQIQVERVSYQSPLHAVLSWASEIAQNPWEYKALALYTAAGSTGGLVVVNRAIKLWEKLSDARIKHADADKAVVSVRSAVADARADEAEADTTVFESRIKGAEARVKEAEARLRESEVELKIKAHRVIHSQLDVVQAIYAAGSGATSDVDTTALLQELNQAANSLASIEDMKVLED